MSGPGVRRRRSDAQIADIRRQFESFRGDESRDLDEATRREFTRESREIEQSFLDEPRFETFGSSQALSRFRNLQGRLQGALRGEGKAGERQRVREQLRVRSDQPGRSQILTGNRRTANILNGSR